MRGLLFIMIMITTGPLAARSTARDYTVTRLVDLRGAIQSWALDVNEAGQVAGSFLTDGGKRTLGFVWHDGQIIEQIVPTPGDQRASPPEIVNPAHHVEATAINEAGVATGHALIIGFGHTLLPYFTPIPARREWPRLLSAAVLPRSVAADITSTDPMLCIGWGWTVDGGQTSLRGFALLVTVDEGAGDPPQFELVAGLGALESGVTAQAANSAWTIVGGAETATGHLVAYRRDWSAGVVEPLGTLGGPSSEALDINDNGQIVGWAHVAPGQQHAFLFKVDRMQDLGTLGGPNSTASGINETGQVVGEAWTDGGEVHAFLYEGGAMHDLNDLIPSGSGWILQHACAINDAGWIVGSGWIDGESHAFLLRPQAPGDLNGDGVVGLPDLLLLLEAWGPCKPPCPADLDDNGVVGFTDLLLLLDHWG